MTTGALDWLGAAVTLASSGEAGDSETGVSPPGGATTGAPSFEEPPTLEGRGSCLTLISGFLTTAGADGLGFFGGGSSSADFWPGTGLHNRKSPYHQLPCSRPGPTQATHWLIRVPKVPHLINQGPILLHRRLYHTHNKIMLKWPPICQKKNAIPLLTLSILPLRECG